MQGLLPCDMLDVPEQHNALVDAAGGQPTALREPYVERVRAHR